MLIGVVYLRAMAGKRPVEAQLEVTKATTALGQLATGFKTRGNLSCLNSRTALAAN
jgi:hypothetical protein